MSTFLLSKLYLTIYRLVLRKIYPKTSKNVTTKNLSILTKIFSFLTICIFLSGCAVFNADEPTPLPSNTNSQEKDNKTFTLTAKAKRNSENQIFLLVKSNAPKINIRYFRNKKVFSSILPVAQGQASATVPNNAEKILVYTLTVDKVAKGSPFNVPIPPEIGGIEKLSYDRQDAGAPAFSPGGTLYTIIETEHTVDACGIGFTWILENGKEVYVTAQHCLREKPEGTKVFRGEDDKQRDAVIYDTLMGIFDNPAVFKEKGLDLAFISKTSNESNPYESMIYSDSSITGRNAIPIVGSAIPKIGMSVCVAGAYRGTSCGYKVVQKIDNIDINLSSFKNMWAIIRTGSCQIGKGDSGSTVYTVNKSNKNTAQALGILNAMGTDANGNCLLYFTDTGEIEKAYGGKILVHKIK